MGLVVKEYGFPANFDVDRFECPSDTRSDQYSSNQELLSEYGLSHLVTNYRCEGDYESYWHHEDSTAVTVSPGKRQISIEAFGDTEELARGRIQLTKNRLESKLGELVEI